MRPALPHLRYVINMDGVLTKVEAEYLLSGTGYEVQSYRLASCVGSDLMSFVSGETTRRFWQRIFEKVRRTQVATVVRYRCDAPDLKRFMSVSIAPGPEGSLTLSHFVDRTEPLPVALRFSTERAPERTRCSLCNDVRHGGAWLSPEMAWGLGLLRSGSPNLVNYAVCGSCQALAEE